MPKGYAGTSKKRPIRIIDIPLVCNHTVAFDAKIRPHPGEIIWCGRCDDYREVSVQ